MVTCKINIIEHSSTPRKTSQSFSVTYSEWYFWSGVSQFAATGYRKVPKLRVEMIGLNNALRLKTIIRIMVFQSLAITWTTLVVLLSGGDQNSPCHTEL